MTKKESQRNFIDPHCGMTVSEESTFRVVDPNDKEGFVFFCSKRCRDAFVSSSGVGVPPQSKREEERDAPVFFKKQASHASSKPSRAEELRAYYPLLLILSYLLGIVFLIEQNLGETHPSRAMNHFMAGFFLIFSFFKLLDLKGFVRTYRTYDLLAEKFRFYGWIYPFLELTLGASYSLGTHLYLTHLLTVLLMGVSSIGVTRALIKQKTISCACLGTFFKLPMTKVTLFEDLLMLLMASFGLLTGS